MIDLVMALISIITLILIIMCYNLSSLHNRNVIKPTKKIKKEYFPPNDLNSLEASLAYEGVITQNDIVSLLLNLAGKEYIKIVYAKPIDSYVDMSQLLIRKLRNYNGDNEIEKNFFNLLFKNNTKLYGIELTYNMRNIISIFSNIFNTDTYKNKYFDVTLIKKKEKMRTYMKFIAIICFLIPIILLSFFTPIKLLIIFSLGILALLLMFGMYKNTFTRTVLGEQAYLKVNAFKSFIENPTETEIKNLLHDNPYYIYDILPYAYSLNIPSTFISNFGTYLKEEPFWFDAPGKFDGTTFLWFLYDFIKNLKISSN